MNEERTAAQRSVVTRVSAVVASSEQVFSNLDGEAVILNLRDEKYYGLDPIGARIWSLIQQPATVSEVCGTLMREYEVEAAQCECDVLALLQSLADVGLVEVRDAPGA